MKTRMDSEKRPGGSSSGGGAQRREQLPEQAPTEAYAVGVPLAKLIKRSSPGPELVMLNSPRWSPPRSSAG